MVAPEPAQPMRVELAEMRLRQAARRLQALAGHLKKLRVRKLQAMWVRELKPGPLEPAWALALLAQPRLVALQAHSNWRLSFWRQTIGARRLFAPKRCHDRRRSGSRRRSQHCRLGLNAGKDKAINQDGKALPAGHGCDHFGRLPGLGEDLGFVRVVGAINVADVVSNSG